MTKKDHVSIDAELIGALRADAARGPGPAVQARVFSRLGGSIAGLAAPAAGSTLGASGGVTPTAGPLITSMLTHPVGIGLIAAALGGVGAASYPSESSSPNVAPVQSAAGSVRLAPPVARSHAAPAVQSMRAALPEPAPTPEVVQYQGRPGRPQAPPRMARVAESRPTPPAPASLAEQQALLDKARKALARGESQQVLDTLEAHSTSYPRSDLAEEREALAIKALVAGGHHAAARERGARFKQQFPNSLLLPSVTHALEPIP